MNYEEAIKIAKSGKTLSYTKSFTKKSLTAASHSGWSSADTDKLIIPDMSFIAYWNGAYNASGNSNLLYCAKGAFGDMATASKSSYYVKGDIDTKLTDGSVTKLGTGTTGAANTPIYWSNGKPAAVTLVDTANNLINSLTTGTTTPVDADYYIAQYAGGGTTTTTYHRRPHSALYAYIKGKAEGTWAISISGNAATASKLGTANVGSGTQHFYLSGGTATASTSTVGSASKPMYLKAGVMTACSYDFTSYLPLAGGTMAAGARISHTDGNMYLGRSDNNGWVMCQDLCSQTAAGDGYWSLRTNGVLHAVSGVFSGNTTVGSLTVGDINVTKSSTGILKIDGNLVVTGGITMYATDGVASGLMEQILVDGTTIGKKADGTLYAINTGNVRSIIMGSTTYTPNDSGAVTLPEKVTWANIEGKPSTFAPSSHTHAISQITNLQATLDGKAAASHTHSYLPLSGGTISNDLTVNGQSKFKCGYFHKSNPTLGALSENTFVINPSSSSGNRARYGLYIWDDIFDGTAKLQSGYEDGDTHPLGLALQPLGGNVGIGYSGDVRSLGYILSVNGSINGTSVYYNGNACIHAGNIGSQSVNYATNSTYLYASDSPYRYGDSSPYYMKMRYNVNNDGRWYLSVYPETPKYVAVDYSYTSGNADALDGLHAADLVRFYLSPLDTGASASSAKSWFTNTMPSGTGGIIYNVPGSEKTIIAGKSTGAYGHLLQLNYDDTYLRILRYYNGSWKSTDWEKISAGYADSSGNADTLDGNHASAFATAGHTHSYLPLSGGTMTGAINLSNANAKLAFGVLTTSPITGYKAPALLTNGVGIYSRYGGSNDEGAIIITEDTCVIYNSADTGWNFQVMDKDLGTDLTNDATRSFGVNQAHQAWSLAGFVKSGSSDSYVLLGGGGHKEESSLSVASAATATKLTSSAGSATLPIYFSDGKPVACTASSVFSNLSNSGNNISVTVAGQNRTLTVGYADTVDGWHLGEFHKSACVTSPTSGLSSYWGKLWDITITTWQYNDMDMTLLLHSSYNSRYSIVNVRLRQNGSSGAYNFSASLHILTGNISTSDMRLYYNNSTGACSLWVNCWVQYGVVNCKVLSYTMRTGSEDKPQGTFYTTTFSSAQTLPSSSYVNGTLVGNVANSDTCDGLHVHGGRNNEANKIVRTDGSGYLQVGYINSSNGNEGNNSSPARVWGTNGSDSYMRTYLTSALSVKYAASAGNADTLDGNHASAFAFQGAHNNLLAAGNEFTFASSGFSGDIYFNYRTAGGTNGNIKSYIFGNGKGGSLGTALHTGNYNSYAPTLKGTGASGTWGISVSGNAATASKWATARKITLTGSVTGSVSIDGSGDVTLATTTNHTHSYLPLSGGTMSNTNVVTNLNADLLDGNHASAFATAGHTYSYLPLAGGTMTGTINANDNTQNTGIKFKNNNANLNAFNDQHLILGKAIRFGAYNTWDWNVWAGLKYDSSSKTIYLGLADGTTFNANSAQSGGSLRFPGVSTVYAPIFSGSLSGNASTATNADKLDGVHYANILEREYTALAENVRAAGWYRIAKTKTSDAAGVSFILMLNRGYSNTNNESYTFSVNMSYSGNISITQLSGSVNVRLITKIRIDKVADGVSYIDIYYTGTVFNYLRYTTIGAATCISSTYNPTLAGTAVEFSTSTGIATNKDIVAHGGITMYSDLRKKNILSNEVLSVKEIAAAPLFRHTYKSDDNQYIHVGTSAQYWSGIHEDWFTRKDSEGYYQMELQNLGVAMGISLAREIVKYESKTDKKIKLMKKKINDLEEANKALDARIKELEERRTA